MAGWRSVGRKENGRRKESRAVLGVWMDEDGRARPQAEP